MRRFFKSVFGVSSKEVNGIIVLVVIFLLSLAYPTLHRLLSSDIQPMSLQDAARLDSLVALFIQSDKASLVVKERFSFNPNAASAADLSRLGFNQRTVRQIINYRTKGGQFQIKKDLYKIYSIDSGLVSSLYSYIDLPVKPSKEYLLKKPKEDLGKLASQESPVQTYPKTVHPPVENFDLNLADTAMLQTINGIGSVLAKRIIAFRDKLGGFVSESQLYEVYNLDSAVVDSLLVVGFVNDPSRVKHLRINSLSEEELAAHPYVSRKQARLIIAFRNQHGSYSNDEDLLQVYQVNNSDIKRLRPYLHYD